MASLHSIATEHANDIRNGIAWIIVWKEGRSWNAYEVYADPYTDDYEDFDIEKAQEVLEADRCAVIINGNNCGHFSEDMNISELADGIRWHYDNGYNMLSDFLLNVPNPTESNVIEVHGKYNTAKIFTDVVDDVSIDQIRQLCDQEFVSGSKIRLMPDVHAGAGCTIGTTMTITDKVVPNLVGVDIGCGMETVKIAEKDIDLSKLDRLIYERIPSGFEIRETPHEYAKNLNLEDLYCYDQIKEQRAMLSIGTLGGGNHFIEADRDNDGNIYIVVHSGSRHLGVEVASYYQNEGYLSLNSATKTEVRELIAQLKAEGRHREIQTAVEELKNSKHTDIPKELSYVSGETFKRYIHDMKIVQQYAMINRKAMIDEILRGMNLTPVEQFTTIHNYIDTYAMILRKGAVSAAEDEKLLIPINMRDGSLICVGKGNDDWNQSAPHGAGRLMSRAAARRDLTMSEFEKEMEGIYSTSVNEATIDESPMAYKSMKDIVNNIGDTVDIVKVIKPIYNFKAGEEQ